MKVFRDVIRALDADPSHPLLWLGLGLFSLMLCGATIGIVYAQADITFRDIVGFIGALTVFAISLHKLTHLLDW